MKRDLLSIRDLSAQEILNLVAKAQKMKAELFARTLPRSLDGKIVGLVFLKPSTRTRVSFEAAVFRLGGRPMFMTAQDTQIARKEPLADMARVLERYIDAVVMRTFAQSDVEELARFASIPVINALTDRSHPCQVLADLMTIREKRGSLDNLTVAWVGDGNNVANSWIYAAGRLGFSLNLACPPGYEPDRSMFEWAARQAKGKINPVADPREAVQGADVLYTDVWASMGQEREAGERMKAFERYQINSHLLKFAPPHAIVLHCLPAHRGEEITEEVLEGPRAPVFDQAENRLHLQMALLDWMIGSRENL
ncbi:MAG TPA: ornithine carbamoyltransferase [Syntrophobacteraceae bacterium]|nr:ornithine carbamoyltransferase [Syntrophobacteraceae bacterium]